MNVAADDEWKVFFFLRKNNYEKNREYRTTELTAVTTVHKVARCSN